MGMLATTGATCNCTFGTTPCTLQVTSQTSCMAEGKPIATIQDMQPGSNLPTFGMCSSMANPAVASATAAALGVLTPQPCTLMPAGPWMSSNQKVLVGGSPALTGDATLVCGIGAGTISITNPGQTKAVV